MILVGKEMTGDHPVGLLIGSGKEQAVGTEGFPWGTRHPPRCLRSSLHTPRNPQSMRRVSLAEAGQASPPRPAPAVGSRDSRLRAPNRAAPRATERASLHLQCTRPNLEPRVRVHGEITDSRYSWGLCEYLEFEEILQKPAAVGDKGSRWRPSSLSPGQAVVVGRGVCGKPRGPLSALTPPA